MTSAVSIGLASTGAGIFLAGSAASATNAAMQKLLNGEVNVSTAVIGGFATSTGGWILWGDGGRGVMGDDR